MYLMRVSLPDQPGSLGKVATVLGGVGVDIIAVEIVDQDGATAINDFILKLPLDRSPEAVVAACQALEGVVVEWISRYASRDGLQSDLETLERMISDPEHAGETLTAACPVVFRVLWGLLLDVAAEPRVTFSTPMAPPNLQPADLHVFRPFDATHLVDLPGGWLPHWGESCAALAPMSHARAVVIGRLGGPAFRPSEVARLGHLATLAT